MKGRKTHMAREVEVHMEWKLGKKKYSQIISMTIQLCQPQDVFSQPTYWMYKEGYLTKRWKNVTCKNCLMRRNK